MIWNETKCKAKWSVLGYLKGIMQISINLYLKRYVFYDIIHSFWNRNLLIKNIKNYMSLNIKETSLGDLHIIYFNTEKIDRFI